MSKNLERLRELCSSVNRRYAADMNDDDQVSRMFAFAGKHDDVAVLIGLDDYQAILKTDLNEIFKQKILGDEEFTTESNGRVYNKQAFFIGNKLYRSSMLKSEFEALKQTLSHIKL